jgi:MFS family permease
MAISSNLGFIVGPALAGILGSTIYGEMLPVLAALILSLVTLIVIGLALKEFKSSDVVFQKKVLLGRFLPRSVKNATMLKILKDSDSRISSS